MNSEAKRKEIREFEENNRITVGEIELNEVTEDFIQS